MSEENEVLFCEVTFDTTPKRYAYRTYIKDLVQGDTCVAYGKRLGLVTFQAYCDPTDIATAHIIAKIDPEIMKKAKAAKAAME